MCAFRDELATALGKLKRLQDWNEKLVEKIEELEKQLKEKPP